jgi:TfoX/Sxy family transcriptional regulator of competence genes
MQGTWRSGVAYDEDLADRVRAVLPPGAAVTERRMFGGLAFLLGGHMFCGVVKDTLMVRLGAEDADRAVDQPHVRPMDFTGRPMKSMVFVDPEGLRGDALRQWGDAAGDAERRQQISRTSSGPEVLVPAAATWSRPRRCARSR